MEQKGRRTGRIKRLISSQLASSSIKSVAILLHLTRVRSLADRHCLPNDVYLKQHCFVASLKHAIARPKTRLFLIACKNSARTLGLCLLIVIMVLNISGHGWYISQYIGFEDQSIRYNENYRSYRFMLISGDITDIGRYIWGGPISLILVNFCYLGLRASFNNSGWT